MVNIGAIKLVHVKSLKIKTYNKALNTFALAHSDAAKTTRRRLICRYA